MVREMLREIQVRVSKSRSAVLLRMAGLDEAGTWKNDPI